MRWSPPNVVPGPHSRLFEVRVISKIRTIVRRGMRQDKRLTEKEIVSLWCATSYSERLEQVVELSIWPVSPSHQPPVCLSVSGRLLQTDPWISPTTVTGDETCITLLSRIKTSFVFSQISLNSASLSSCFLNACSMHWSKLNGAIRSWQY